MSKKVNYLHVELPSLHLIWQRSGRQDIVCSVIRTNYPKPSTLLVPAIIRGSGVADVKAIDMKIRHQERIVPYREFSYEGGKMIASRMGMTFNEILEEIKWADVIGLSINPSSWSNIAIDFIRYAKSINPQVKIIIGGTDAIFRFNQYLSNGADAVVRGEGENSGVEAIRSLWSSGSLSGIPGIATCQHNSQIEKGIHMNQIPLQALDLFKEDIPMWNMNVEGNIPREIETPIGFLFITRGCNQSCEFCTTPQKYGQLRFQNLSQVQEELELLQNYGIKTINIWDDSLSSLIRWGKRDYLIQIARLLRSMGFAYEFSQGMVIKDLWNNVTNAPDYELIHELFQHEIIGDKWVGCYGEYFPMEFLQEEATEKMSPKLMSYEKELMIMRAILSEGVLWLTYSCIFGRPQDGNGEMNLATERLNEVTSIVESYGASGLPTPYIFSIFPGAKLWEKQGYKLQYSIEQYPELYQLNATPHGTNFYSPGELMEVKMALERRVLTSKQCEKWWKTGRYQWK